MHIFHIKKFLQLESYAGIFLIAATILAMIVANTDLRNIYAAFVEANIAITAGQYHISKPFTIWVNDALMVIFFFLVGLELKREFVEGHLSDPKQVILPVIGALGGIIVPALVFYAFNKNHSTHLIGWAIPAATDIAFALGILALSSRSVPIWAKIFLMTLAIFDDLAAICIIAIFYTINLSILALWLGLIGIAALLFLNRFKVLKITPYFLVGLYLWSCILQSGVHATLAGVITALFIPVSQNSKNLETNLHPWVAFGILPIFAFANTGINLQDFVAFGAYNTITIGVALGLFIGKQLGIFTFSYATIKLLKIKLPKGFSFSILYGVSLLGGIGFTMSLFVSSLAYGNTDLAIKARLGILIGTIASAIFGFIVLRYTLNKSRKVQA